MTKISNLFEITTQTEKELKFHTFSLTFSSFNNSGTSWINQKVTWHYRLFCSISPFDFCRLSKKGARLASILSAVLSTDFHVINGKIYGQVQSGWSLGKHVTRKGDSKRMKRDRSNFKSILSTSQCCYSNLAYYFRTQIVFKGNNNEKLN